MILIKSILIKNLCTIKFANKTTELRDVTKGVYMEHVPKNGRRELTPFLFPCQFVEAFEHVEE